MPAEDDGTLTNCGERLMIVTVNGVRYKLWPGQTITNADVARAAKQADRIAELEAALDVAHKWVRCIHPPSAETNAMWVRELKQIELVLGSRRTAR